MNVLGLLHAEASWWRAHLALPSIIREHVDNPAHGVEVGVAFGSMSIWLTRLLPQLRMLAVDPFVAYDPADGMSDYMAGAGDEVEQLVRWRFATEGHDRIELWRQTSLEAAVSVPHRSKDFVFLDADHRYEAVVEDIAVWRSRVRSGGLLCGHDYCDEWPGVVQAVHSAFADGVQFHAPSRIWWVRIP